MIGDETGDRVQHDGQSNDVSQRSDQSAEANVAPANDSTDQRAPRTPEDHTHMTNSMTTSDATSDATGETAGAVAGADDGAPQAPTPAVGVATDDAPADAATTDSSGSASSANDANSAQPTSETDANGADAATLAEAPTRRLDRSRGGATPAAREPATPEPVAETPAAPPFAVGATLGAYRIDAIAHEAPGAMVYLASLAEDAESAHAATDGADDADDAGDGDAASALGRPRFTITERSEPPSTVVSALVALALRHPRLLTPVAIETNQGRWYLVRQDIDAEPGANAQLVAEGGRLTPIEGLRAGAGLADALSYLNRNGVAHLHVSPETILTHDSRAYLTGVEMATLVDWTSPDTALLFARDANFLARTLGALVGLEPNAEPAEPTGAAVERAVREIVARGEAGAYTEPDEVGAACAAALRSFGVAQDSVAEYDGSASYPTTRLIFTSGSATTVGRVRTQNQDAFAISQFDVCDDATGDAPFAIFLVSDGMGGEAHGEVASRITARAVTVEMARHFTLPTLLWPILSLEADNADAKPGGATPAGEPTLAQALEKAVGEANRQTRVFARMLGAATGATLTAIAVSGAHAALAHLGDSRAYLLREMRLIQLTEDHSLLARLIAMDHPLLSDPSFVAPRSVLYRSVGQDDEAPPDMLEFTFSAGDRVLLCSDGLWDELDDQTIGQELAQATDPRECAQRLVDLANEAGGHDNSTAVVIFVSAERSMDDEMTREAADALTPTDADDTAATDALDASLGLYQPYNPDGLDDPTDEAFTDPIDPTDLTGLAASPQPSGDEL